LSDGIGSSKLDSMQTLLTNKLAVKAPAATINIVHHAADWWNIWK
jgi:hypothetical protein